MEPKTREEIARMWRYVVVKCITKGEYLIVSVVTYFNYGSIYASYAFAVSFFFSNILDFFGQKYWVFKNKKELSWKLAQDVFLYSLVRTVNFFCALWLFTFIFNEYKSVLIAGVSVGIIFIPLGFVLYRWLFIGTIKSLANSLK